MAVAVHRDTEGEGVVTVVLVEREPWTALANCLGVDPDLFFPTRGETSAEAKHVCSTCPVRADCLNYALDHNEQHGVWGGLGRRARERIRWSFAADTKRAAS